MYLAFRERNNHDKKSHDQEEQKKGKLLNVKSKKKGE